MNRKQENTKKNTSYDKVLLTLAGCLSEDH